jgi:exopolysaccharide biosynthesis polyprenyl glycosylphosphotransferase
MEDMVTLPQPDNNPRLSTLNATAEGEREFLFADSFKRRISLERKRTERSAKPFLLMLLETGRDHSGGKDGAMFSGAISALMASTRETDVVGWYEDQRALGVMFTDLVIYEKNLLLSAMLSRVSNILRDNLTFEQFNRISISFHFFPDNWDHDTTQRPSNPMLYPDLSQRHKSARLSSMTKRVMDVIGSMLILAVLSPVLLIVALAVKLSSKGPVFYSQQRVGQYGRPFTFIKFRSMYVGNDSRIHQEYVAQLIAGQAQRHSTNVDGNGSGNDDGAGVYKLTNDPRITPVGSFLRRTSLDELPQLVNVLRGEMSLVGPRPAIPYEVAKYQTWHRRRVLEVKPGITGLWQVNGRCRIGFDEMVRLDLRYAKAWSPWFDVKILLRTPRAVFLGEGAH